MRTEPLSLWVPGIALSERKRNVRLGSFNRTIDTPERRDWKAYVKALVATACPEPFAPKVPLCVEVCFVRTPPAHPRKRHPRPQDLWPVTKPDLTNLWKATEDAMNGVVYVDDAQICEELLTKTYGAPGLGPGVRVDVRMLTEEEL